MTHIWVDADAAPRPVKETLYRAAVRTETQLTLVANQPLDVPRSRFVSSVQVAAGFDVADNYIVQHAKPGDLVITQDIPLAAELVEAGVDALNPRGEPYTSENVRQRLNMRDFNETMRASGLHTGGPAAFGNAEKQAFANALDRWLARNR